MTIGAALRAHLLDDAAIVARVDARVYPLRLPQPKPAPAVNLPAITYQRISGFRFAHLRGAEALARPRYQVDCYAQTHDAAQALGSLVRQRLNGFSGNWSDEESPETVIHVVVLFDSEQDLFDPDILGGSARHSADYFVFHGTAQGQV